VAIMIENKEAENLETGSIFALKPNSSKLYRAEGPFTADDSVLYVPVVEVAAYKGINNISYRFVPKEPSLMAMKVNRYSHVWVFRPAIAR
jgi:hypothetical protein